MASCWPSRSTLSASGAPLESRTVWASASQVVVERPSTASTLSPVLRPACSAGEPGAAPGVRGLVRGTRAAKGERGGRVDRDGEREFRGGPGNHGAGGARRALRGEAPFGLVPLPPLVPPPQLFAVPAGGHRRP